MIPLVMDKCDFKQNQPLKGIGYLVVVELLQDGLKIGSRYRMSDKKVCPLRLKYVGNGQDCIEEKCAWYIARDGYCAIKTIAYYQGA